MTPSKKTAMTQSISSKNREAGFTLTEAMMATFILMFGLASIFNLMIVSVSSNSLASRASGATSLTSQQMETLRSTPFTGLVDGPLGADTLETQTAGYFLLTTIDGVGSFETRWEIKTLNTPNIKYLRVRTEPAGLRGRAARAEMTSIRSCTTGTASGCL